MSTSKTTAKTITKGVDRKVHSLDATDKVFGRFAVEVAGLLSGKSKIEFKKHLDIGDFVEIENIEKMKFTGTKLDTKMKYHHSGYPGGLKEETLGTAFEKNPGKTFKDAVRGMLPKNRLANNWLKRLKIK